MRNDQKAVIEQEVRQVLEQSPAYHAMSVADRQGILASTTRVASQLVAQQLQAPPRKPVARRADPYALGLADLPPMPPMPGDPMPPMPGDPTTAAPPGPDNTPWRPDERFRAEGIAAGVTQAGRMVKEVDFPAFVSSLVKGVFNAVVDASIQQMKAYGELVNSVAMSITDFADQHVDPGEGQKHLAKKYPDIFDMSSGSLKVKDDYDDESMPNFQAELGLDAPVEDLSDEESLQKLITASRTEIARGRQQLLATTILMGINRIIVTDGKINAKIRFDFTAHDSMQRSGQINEYEKSIRDIEMSVGDKYVKGHFEQPLPLKVSTTSAVSQADITAEATLQGSVSLNFKSETFPLEKMMSSTQLFQLNQAQSGGARGVPAPPAAAAPAAPAAPAPPAPPAAPVAPPV
jgi:hypothetical protein